MVKVSVIIPIYNTEKYLQECIESVLEQTLKDIEILLINDGSTDNSFEICKQYASKDKRIKLFNQENQGVSATRNKGIENSNGEYLYFLDSDDMIEKNFLEYAYNIAIANNSDLTICDDRNIPNIPVNEFATVPTYGSFVKRIFLDNYKDVRFPVNIQPSEDGIFSHKILCLTNKISFSPNSKYFYRQHPAQNSKIFINNTDEVLNQISEIYKSFEEFYNKYNLWDSKYFILTKFIAEETFCSRYVKMQLSFAEKKKLYNIINNFFQKKLKKYFQKKQMNQFNIDFKQLIYSKNFEFYFINRSIHKNKFIQENYLIYRFLKNFLRNKIINLIKLLKKLKAQIKFIHPAERKFLKKFFKNIDDSKILIVEMNDCHNEVIPGYLKYLYELNYKCDILITNNSFRDNVFCNIPNDLYENLYWTRGFIIKKILESSKVKKYNKILITSNFIYMVDFELTKWKNLQDYNKILFVEHNIKYITKDLLNKHKYLCLNNFNREELDKNIVNPHYFGNIKITDKNEITQFLIIGRVTSSRQNYTLITNIINTLKNKNIFNYKITVVGADFGTKLSSQLLNEKNLVYKGRLNFADMYNEIENSDFLITLFDDKKLEHLSYKKSVTSGQIQLSCGFLKPTIIQKDFATNFGFDNNNSVLYDNNITDVIEKCIKMDNENYKKLQSNLNEYSSKLYKKSLENLKEILEYER